MYKKLLLFVCFGVFLSSYGQQDPQYTQFMFNKQMYNPAVTGFNGKHCVSLLARSQYAQFDDQTYTLNDATGIPIELTKARGAKTVAFSYGAPIPFARAPKGLNSGGVGLSVYSDRAGYLSTNYFKADLAFRRQLNRGDAIGIGFNIGAMQKIIDVGGLLYKDPGDPRIPTSVNPSNIAMNFGGGVWYNNPDLNNLSVGYAIQNLAGAQFDFAGVAALAPGWHQYLNVSAEFPNLLPVVLKPYMLVKASQDGPGFANPDINLGIMADVNSSLEAGIGMRTSTKTFESASAIIGYNLNPKLRIGYAFDLNTSKLRGNNANTHEVILNYCFSISIPPPIEIIIVDPRHLDKEPGVE